MAGKITYQIEFKGLTQAINGLKKIEGILANIAKYQGMLGNVKMPTADKILPRLEAPPKITASGAPPMSKKMEEEERRKKQLINAVSHGDMGKFPELLSKGGFKQLFERIAQRWEKIIGPRSDATENFRKGASEFASILRGAGASRMAQFMVAFGKGTTAITLLVGAALLAYKSLGQLADGARYADELYRRAARSGVGLRRTTQLDEALKILGVTEEPNYLMRSAKGPEEIMAAMRASNFENAQHIRNLSREFIQAMNTGKSSARQMEAAAWAGKEVSIITGMLQREWRTMWAQLIQQMFGLIAGFGTLLYGILKLINYILEIAAFLNPLTLLSKTILGGKGRTQPGEERWFGSSTSNISGWEKMGFTFPTGEKVADKLKDISNHTRDTVEELKTWRKLGQLESKNPPPIGAKFLY